MARPKKFIDLELAEKLATIQCTQEEIAVILGVSVATLQRNEEFCSIYKKAKENGKSSLRRMQWKSAEKGNVTMQIWLGKQYLQQRDQPKDEEDEAALKELVEAIRDAASVQR